jgi:hypothetical protein
MEGVEVPEEYNPKIREYAGGKTFCIEDMGWYIFADGIVRNFSGGVGASVEYKTKTEAHTALTKYKGENV